MSLATSTPVATSHRMPTTARGIATRRRLLAAAEAEFGERGFHATSVSSITQRATVGQGTFYLYFQSKEEIFQMLVGQISRKLQHEMAEARHRESGVLAGEKAALRRFLNYARRHPGLYRILQECQLIDATAFRAYFEALMRDYHLRLGRAVDLGELREVDPQVLTWMLIGIGHFVGLAQNHWQDDQAEDRIIDTIMTVLADGVRGEPSYAY